MIFRHSHAMRMRGLESARAKRQGLERWGSIIGFLFKGYKPKQVLARRKRLLPRSSLAPPPPLTWCRLWRCAAVARRYYFWETIIMARKVIFAVISVVLRTSGVDIQAYVGLGVLAVALALQIKLEPYDDPAINRMELRGMCAIALRH